MKTLLFEITGFYTAIGFIVLLMVICITVLVSIESKTRKNIAFDHDTIVAVSNSRKLTGILQFILCVLAVSAGIFYLMELGI